MKKALILFGALTILWTPSLTAAQTSTWSGDTAVPMPQGRWEFGIFAPLHWSPTDEVELSTHALLPLVMPHLEAKILWRERYPFYVATRHRLTYPTLLLQFLSREGTLGLLPPTTDVPQSVIIETDLVGTLAMDCTHWATMEVGLSVAPRGRGDMPLLDFPFLYPRFGVLNAPATLHAGAGIEGELIASLTYSVDVDVWWIPAFRGGFALEHGLSLGWRFSNRIAITGGYRWSRARYPVGVRNHLLPYADVLFGF